MHGACLRPQRLEECLRKDVLPGVLLHVVESPRPVDAAGHNTRDRSGDHVKHAILVVFDDLCHRQSAQRAGVVRLAAGRRVKCAAVEDHRQAVAVGLHREHGRVELREIAIRIVETQSHDPPPQRQ